MHSRTSRLLTALHLLVVVALIAAVVHLYSARTAPPGVTVDGFGTAAQEIAGGEVESDFFGSELKWIPASAFIPDSGATITLNGITGCVASDSNIQVISAPVDLPDDATVSSVTAYVHDNDGGGNLNMQLTRTNTTAIAGGSGPSRENIFTTFSGTGDDSGYQDFTDSSSFDPGTDNVIDLVTYSYSMEVIAGGTTQFCGARIIWLPESTTELTFHEVEPCAVFDTRAGKGGRDAPLSGGQTVAFDTIMSDYSSQGGVATSCGVPAPNGGLFSNGEGTVAVMLNLVALNPASTGNLKAWDPDTSEPDGGILVYTGGQNTNVVLPMAVQDAFFSFPGEDGGDVNIKNNGSQPVDVRGVVVGYFTTPLLNQE